MMATTIVRKSPINGTPPDKEMINMESLEPSPVIESVPEMIPAAAQAIEIGTALLTPVIVARLIFRTNSSRL